MIFVVISICQVYTISTYLWLNIVYQFTVKLKFFPPLSLRNLTTKKNHSS